MALGGGCPASWGLAILPPTCHPPRGLKSPWVQPCVINAQFFRLCVSYSTRILFNSESTTRGGWSGARLGGGSQAGDLAMGEAPGGLDGLQGRLF